jgi:hypothetical protein
MPAQQRLGPDERPVPAQASQQPHQSSQHGSVCPIHPRSGHLPPQYRDLVAQHEQLGVLGGRTPRQQGNPRHHLAEHQVDQSQDHAGDHRGPMSSPTNSQLSTHDRFSGTHRPMRGLKQDRSARAVIAGHALVQNLRRGHYELAVETPVNLRLPVAFVELALAI